MVCSSTCGRACQRVELTLYQREHEGPSAVGMEVAAQHSKKPGGVATCTFNESIGVSLVRDAEVVGDAS